MIRPPAVQPCGRCERPTWHRTRRGRRPDGVRSHGAYGYCDTCYRTIRRLRGRHGSSGARVVTHVDQAVVHRVVFGEQLPMNLSERLEVVRVLTARRMSARQIALQTGLCERTVHRLRRRLRETTDACTDALDERRAARAASDSMDEQRGAA